MKNSIRPAENVAYAGPSRGPGVGGNRSLWPVALILLSSLGLLRAADIADVFVQPSVRGKKLTLEIEILGAKIGRASCRERV